MQVAHTWSSMVVILICANFFATISTELCVTADIREPTDSFPA